MKALLAGQLLNKVAHLARCLDPDNADRVRAELEQDGYHILEDSLRLVNLEDLPQLPTNTLTDSPFLLILLELFEYAYQCFPFRLAEYPHDLGNVPDHA